MTDTLYPSTPDNPISHWSHKKGKKPGGWPDFDIHLGCPTWPMCCESPGDCENPNPWDWVEDDDPKKIAHLKAQETEDAS